MRTPSRRERIAAQLADLKMPGALEALDGVLAGVDGGGTTAAEAIERLLAAQIELRNGRRLEAAMRSSRLPYVKTLEAFDFAFQPSIKRDQIDALHELGFVERKENLAGQTAYLASTWTDVMGGCLPGRHYHPRHGIAALTATRPSEHIIAHRGKEAS